METESEDQERLRRGHRSEEEQGQGGRRRKMSDRHRAMSGEPYEPLRRPSINNLHRDLGNVFNPGDNGGFRDATANLNQIPLGPALNPVPQPGIVPLQSNPMSELEEIQKLVWTRKA